MAPPASQTITVFGDRHGLLVFYLLLGAALLIQGILTGVFFLFYSEDTEPGLRTVAVGLAAFICWLGVWFGGYAFRRLRDPDNPIVIGPAGLHDRAVSERPISWADIRNLHVWVGGRGGPVVVFDLAEGAEARAGVRPRVKASAVVNRRFGYGYRIHHMGTEASPERLVAAIAPYAPVKWD